MREIVERMKTLTELKTVDYPGNETIADLTGR
jgi:hypothetical protein